MSQAVYARLAGVTQQTVSRTISGRRNPPKHPDDLERWADALELEGREREYFLFLADLSRSPRRVRDLVKDGTIPLPEGYDLARSLAIRDESLTGRNYFGDYLAVQLEQRHLTPRALARRAGMTTSHVQALLGGSEKPHLDQLDDLVAALALTGDEATECRELAAIMYIPAEGNARDEFKATLDHLIKESRAAAAARLALGTGR